MRKNEHILTTTTEEVNRVLSNKAFCAGELLQCGDSVLDEFNMDSIKIMSRDILENDESHKHIIPYVLIECGGKYLTFQRIGKLGDQRLAGNYSIGFAGHVSIGDVHSSFDGSIIDMHLTLNAAIERELFEEISVSENDTYFDFVEPLFLGLINDDSNSVGKVHLGVVYVVSVDNDSVLKSKEAGINILGFKSINELIEMTGFENWSSILIKYLSNLNN